MIYRRPAALWALAAPLPPLLLALRRLAAAGLDDDHARRLLADQFGAGHVRLLALAQLMIVRLADGATRTVMLAAPCCLALSGDEVALVAVIEAAATGDDAAAHAWLDFVSAAHRAGVVEVAAALGAAACDTRPPWPRAAPTAAQPTLH